MSEYINKRFGKLLVLGGFGAITFLSFISLLLNIFDAYGDIAILFGILRVIASIVITGGFAIVYLAEKEKIDLLITIGFGVSTFSSIIGLFIDSSNIGGTIAVSLLSIVGFAGYFVWSYKLKGFNELAGRLIIWALIGSFVASFVLSFFASALYMQDLPRSAMRTITSVVSCLTSFVALIECAAYSFAAFADLQN